MICSVTPCNVANMTDSQPTPLHPHERLEAARVKAGFDSAAAFAKRVGIHPTTYRAYENGQNGFSKVAPTLAKKLGVSVDWLLTGSTVEPQPAKPEPKERSTPSDQPRIRGASTGDGAIPIRSFNLSYAMGDGTNIDDYFEEEAVLYDPNFIRRVTLSSAENLFLARGDGDSMFPTLVNDDDVLIDTSQRQLNTQDRIWACSVYGVGMIKRLRMIGNGKVEVISDNPGLPNQEIAAQDLHIVGRVIYVGRRT